MRRCCAEWPSRAQCALECLLPGASVDVECALGLRSLLFLGFAVAGFPYPKWVSTPVAGVPPDAMSICCLKMSSQFSWLYVGSMSYAAVIFL